MATLPEIMRMIADTRAELSALDARIARHQAEAEALADRLQSLDGTSTDPATGDSVSIGPGDRHGEPVGSKQPQPVED